MPSITFDETSYNNVRGLIRVNLSAKKLPNTTIDLDVYKGEAIRTVERLLTTEQINAHTAQATSAAYFYCASLLVPAVAQIEMENIAGSEMRWKSYDPNIRAKELEAKANEIISEIQRLDASNNDNRTKFMPQFFGLAKSGKGRV